MYNMSEGAKHLIILYSLPLDPIMLLISELLPQVQELQATHHKANSTSIIVEFLTKVSLKHVFPEVPPPLPRRFMVRVMLFPLCCGSHNIYSGPMHLLCG